jgi:hypothetical protein
MRMGDHKLIEFFEDGRLELYNVREDVGEEHDLLDERPALAQQMMDILVDWRQTIEAKIPQSNPEWGTEDRQ